VFFDGARTGASNVVGDVGGGWQVALATLAFERGVGMLGHLLSFRREFDRLGDLARARGVDADPVLRQRLAQAYIELSVMRCNTLRSLSGFDGPVAPPEASIGKLFWGSWHQRLGELAVDTAGVAATVLEGPDYELSPGQRTFLFSRPRPSTAAPTRSNATSSASVSSACRPTPRSRPPPRRRG